MRRFRIIAILSLWICKGLSSQTSAASSGVKPSLDTGTVIGDKYRNSFFQFSFQLPYGWVDRTSDMRADTETEKSKVLLAIFERPPAAAADTVNSAVIIAAESTAAYPGLRAAADYFGPLTELTESKGFKSVNEPYEFPVDGKPIIRKDFTRSIGGLTIHQSSLVMMMGGYVLSFSFIAGNDDDVVELIEKLNFTKKPRSNASQPAKKPM